MEEAAISKAINKAITEVAGGAEDEEEVEDRLEVNSHNILSRSNRNNRTKAAVGTRRGTPVLLRKKDALHLSLSGKRRSRRKTYAISMKRLC